MKTKDTLSHPGISFRTGVVSFSSIGRPLAKLTGALMLLAMGVQAQVATKTGAGTDLTGATAGVWSGGAGANGSPAATDVATWNGSSLGAGLTLGTPASWGGINVGGALTDIGITGVGSLTLGASGISLSANNLTLGTPVVLGASQLWTANSPETLTLSGAVSGAATTNLTISGGGTVSLAAANSFAGLLTISNGVTLLANTAADGNCSLGAGYALANSLTFGAGGGTLNFTGAAQATKRAITFNGPGNFNIAGGASLTIGTADSSASTTDGAWSGSGGITKSGSGVLIVRDNTTAGTSRFDVNTNGGGNFTMQAGTLIIQPINYFVIGDAGSGTVTGLFNQTGGSVLFSNTTSIANMDVYIGNKACIGALNISGGTFTATNTLAGISTVVRVGSGNASAGSGTLTIGGGGNPAMMDALLVKLCANTAGTGTLNLLSQGTLQAIGLSQVAGTSTLNFNGGTLRAKTNNAAFVGSGFSSAAITANGLTIDNNGFSITNAQALSGAGGLTSTGTGYLALSGANNYASNTLINAGTLALTASGSIASSSSVNIAAGATFDVSAYSTYTWGGSASLTATGTNSLAANINGGTIVDLSSRSVTLNYNPATLLGDAAHPALTVSAGTLKLAGTTIAVNNFSAPLGAGYYVLINGAVSGTPATSAITVGGNGLAAHCSALLDASSGTGLVMHVTSSLPASTTTVSLQSPWTSTSTYGDALVFHVMVTGGSPAPHGGAVTIYDGGVGSTVIGTGTLPGSGGTVNISLSPLNILGATTHNDIVATYGGDADNSASVSAPLAPQMVQPKTLTTSGTVANNKAYDGTTSATITGGSVSGVISGDSISIAGGSFASAGPGSGIGVTVNLAGTAITNYSYTSPSLSADILAAATWTTAGSGIWDTAGNWLESVVGNGTNVTADFSTLDITTDVDVSLNSPRTIGNLLFGDTDTSTPAGWTLDNGGNSANVLTLAGTTPTVTVNALGGNKAVTISATVAGTAGLTKAGPGLLVLSGTNTYTGITDINGGSVTANSAADGNCSLGAGYNVANALTFDVNGGVLNFTGTNQATSRSINYTGAGTFNVAAGAQLTLGTTNGQPTSTLGGWSGSGGMTNAGLGTLIIQNTATSGFLPSRFTVDSNNGGDFTMEAGTLLINANYYFVIGDSATGTFTQTGGSTTFADAVGVTGPDVFIGNKTGTGTMNILGGTFTATNTTAGFPTTIRVCSGNSGSPSGTLTIGGGPGSALVDALQVKLCANTAGLGTLNLESNGVLQANGLSKGNGVADLNFDGGTLRARTNNGSFLPAVFDIVGITANGLTVDNNGFGISIAQPLSGAGGLTCIGSGSLELTADNSSLSGVTVVSNGTFLVDNASGLGTGTGAILVSGGTLGGIGIIGGETTNEVGGTLSPGVGGIGTLTFNNNDLVLQPGSFTAVDVDQTSGHSDLVTGLNSVTYGGTLVVSNLTGTLAVGNSFTLFSASTQTGNFSSIVGSPGAGLAWSFTNGVLQVVAAAPVIGTNATLASLVITPAAPLSPMFATNMLNYTTTVAYANNPVTVTATSADTNATLQLNFNGAGYGPVATNVVSGSTTLMLTPSPLNSVVVKVVAQDGSTTAIYTLNVTLQPSLTPFKLSSSVSGGNTLVLNWPLDHTGYRLLQQTNNLIRGVSKNAGDWGAVTDYTATNTAVIPIIKANLNEYYQLIYP